VYKFSLVILAFLIFSGCAISKNLKKDDGPCPGIHDPNAKVRLKAVMKCKDKDTLASVVLEDESLRVRGRAVKRIRSVSLLKELEGDVQDDDALPDEAREKLRAYIQEWRTVLQDKLKWKRMPRTMPEAEFLKAEKEPVTDADKAARTKALFELVNATRVKRGTYAVAWSPSLAKVAEAHVADLEKHPPQGKCNLHSWSSDGPWVPCCYTPDHKNAKCVTSKPGELTAYKGKGFENAAWDSLRMTPEQAVLGWLQSDGHRVVMLSQNEWKNPPWKALGVAISEHYAVIWFGHEPDPATHKKPVASKTGKGKTSQPEPNTIQELTPQNLEKVLETEKILVVVFTATYCGACKKLMPSLPKINKKLGSRVKIVTFTTDTNRSAGLLVKSLRAQSLRGVPTVWIKLPDTKKGKWDYQMAGLADGNVLQDILILLIAGEKPKIQMM